MRVENILGRNLARLAGSGQEAQIDPVAIEQVTGEVQNLDASAGELSALSSQIKSGYLEEVYTKVPDNIEQLALVNDVLQMSRAADEPQEKIDELSSLALKTYNNFFEQAHQSMRATIAMGLMAGALDAVVVSQLDGQSGSARPEQRPEARSRKGERILDTLYNEPDKAQQRWQKLSSMGPEAAQENCTKHISHHVGSAEFMADRMGDTAEADMFQRAGVRLFANAYHTGLNYTLKNHPELQPKASEPVGGGVEISPDGFLIGDVPLDIEW